MEVLVPEDRTTQGLVQSMSVAQNLSMAVLPKLLQWGLVSRSRERVLVEDAVARLSIKVGDTAGPVLRLSGGNQQKVVLAKSLAAESDILIFDEPTRGIDVGAKQEIYHLMTELADNGIAILMISSDMEELLGMSDRIIVMCEGELAGEVNKDQFEQHHILDLASGMH